MLESGFWPMEDEYLRARERGLRAVVHVRAGASTREGHLRRFVERVRVFLTKRTMRVRTTSLGTCAVTLQTRCRGTLAVEQAREYVFRPSWSTIKETRFLFTRA